jgi:hypothetical protein
MLSNETIQANWDRFLEAISSYKDQTDTEFLPSRWWDLENFYTKYEQRFAFMPASGKLSFHSAYPGGHIDHTLRVYDSAFKIKDLWIEMGAKIDFTDEELAFVALHHDIGKFGTYTDENFIDQDSTWHKERGEVYKHNPAVPFMKDYDRSLFLLQDLGVKTSEAEYLAIKLQSGLYEESNKSYFIAFTEDYKLKSNLPYILHQADAMSARIESQFTAGMSTPAPKKFYKKPAVAAPVATTPAKKSKLSKFLLD